MTGLEITLLLVGIIFMVGSFLITEKLSDSELNKVSELSEDEMQKILERELASAQQKIDAQIEQSIERSVEQSADRVDRALDKETNEKIMAISEFSDTVMENMNKTNNEIMFLYSMLNDKHAAMTENMDELQKLLAEVDVKKEEQKEAQEKELADMLRKFEEHIGEREAEISREVEEKMEGKTAEFVDAINAFLAEKAAQQAQVSQTPELEEEEEAVEEILPEEEQEEEKEAEVEEAAGQQEGNHNALILNLHRQGASDIEIAKELGLGVGEVRLVLGLFREEEV